MASSGYNVFITGEPGSGRMSLVAALLSELGEKRTPVVEDLLYVHNFGDPQRPKLLRLAAGQGRRLQRALEQLARALWDQTPALLESEALHIELKRAAKDLKERQQKLFDELQAALARRRFTLISVENGSEPPQIFALDGAEPKQLEALRLDPEALLRFLTSRRDTPLPEGGAERAEAIASELERATKELEAHQEELETRLREAQRLAREIRRIGREIESKRARALVLELISEVPQELRAPEVQSWLEELCQHVLRNLDAFRGVQEELASASGGVLRPCSANVVRESSPAAQAPVVLEPNPTLSNLFGTIDREIEGELLRSDFAHVRGGSLLRADQGYLVMYARDVLLEPGVWRALVRALRSGLLEIQPSDPAMQLLPLALKPEPIPVQVKVILIGDDYLYELLHSLEPDFPKVFKIKAEFEPSLPICAETVAELSRIAADFAEREKLLPIERSGLAAVVEHAARLAQSRDRISTRYGEILDLVRESNVWAREAGAAVIDRGAIFRAVRERKNRHGSLRDQLARAMRDGQLLVQTSGRCEGQVNGVALLALGPIEVGRPARITATASAGREGVIDLEREAGLSGPSHHKGVLILAGYLRHRYGRSGPIALSASIAMEQSYGEIEGDSASLAELCALLSALSGLPAKQALALTGSVNQLGDVQAVGGVNEKIEAFFALCEARGLTGAEGCILPEANVRALMLEEDVVQAVTANRFRLHAVRSVDDVIPLLFDAPAGELHRRVAQRLSVLARLAPGNEPHAHPPGIPLMLPDVASRG